MTGQEVHRDRLAGWKMPLVKMHTHTHRKDGDGGENV
jgi:hypothetical protein